MSNLGDDFRLENYIDIVKDLPKADYNYFKYNDYLKKADMRLLESQFLPLKEEVEDKGMFSFGNYSSIEVLQAINWSNETGYPIIYPTRSLEELEKLKTNFDSYFSSIQEISDEKSIELFGMKNEIHYEYLRRGFLSNNINESAYKFTKDPIKTHLNFGLNESIDSTTRIRDLLRLASSIDSMKEDYENTIKKDIIDRVTNEYIGSHQNINYDILPYEDLPFYTPDEIIDLGVIPNNPEDMQDNDITSKLLAELSEDTISSISDWFNDYSNTCAGVDNSYNPNQWINTVRYLKFKRDRAEDKTDYDKTLLSLGWPPEAEFSPENRIKAKNRVKSIIGKSKPIQFVDLTGFTTDEDHPLDEAAVSLTKEPLYPIFIVLQSGKSILSAGIRVVTKSVFSHASISFDPELKTMYSYNAFSGNNVGKTTLFGNVQGGLAKESIDEIDPDTSLGVFTIFLKKKDYDNIKIIIDNFVKNAKKTTYASANLILSHIFKIRMDVPYTYVCSEFVDRVLKFTDIDITHKHSSLVAPSDYEKIAKENSKIYMLFNGLKEKYKPSRIKAMITRLLKKNATPIKEYSYLDQYIIVEDTINDMRYLDRLQDYSYYLKSLNNPYINKIIESMIDPCLKAECFTEAKDAFIQFDKEGNMFIKNIKKKDYEAEYAKSHKLLRQYEKARNIDGIKYELCKLWFMNSAIESNLHKKGELNHDDELRVRAKILNDFNHFLSIVLEKEPRFNFEKYFESSPYNDALIKINKDTIIWSARLFKMILNQF